MSLTHCSSHPCVINTVQIIHQAELSLPSRVITSTKRGYHYRAVITTSTTTQELSLPPHKSYHYHQASVITTFQQSYHHHQARVITTSTSTTKMSYHYLPAELSPPPSKSYHCQYQYYQEELSLPSSKSYHHHQARVIITTKQLSLPVPPRRVITTKQSYHYHQARVITTTKQRVITTTKQRVITTTNQWRVITSRNQAELSTAKRGKGGN